MTTRTKKHVHEAILEKTVTRCFSGSVNPWNENRAAHGGVALHEECSCGAIRAVNANGRHTEEGEWEMPAQRSYRIGSINTNRGNRRPLYIAETQETIAWIESDTGPAIIGDMTEAQARRRFPEAFARDED
jgi:hypothetical protein